MVIIIRGGVGASVGCMGMEFPRKKPTNCTGMQPEVRNGEGYPLTKKVNPPPNIGYIIIFHCIILVCKLQFDYHILSLNFRILDKLV